MSSKTQQNRGRRSFTVNNFEENYVLFPTLWEVWGFTWGWELRCHTSYLSPLFSLHPLRQPGLRVSILFFCFLFSFLSWQFAFHSFFILCLICITTSGLSADLPSCSTPHIHESSCLRRNCSSLNLAEKNKLYHGDWKPFHLWTYLCWLFPNSSCSCFGQFSPIS